MSLSMIYTAQIQCLTYVFEIMSVIQRGEEDEDEEARRKPMYPDITSIVGPVYTIQ